MCIRDSSARFPLVHVDSVHTVSAIQPIFRVLALVTSIAAIVIRAWAYDEILDARQIANKAAQHVVGTSLNPRGLPHELGRNAYRCLLYTSRCV